MKSCPVCGKTYSDPDINFCLNDGELLSRLPPSREVSDEPPPTMFADDSPPTLMMDRARVTNQNWQTASPPVPWQQQSPDAVRFASMVPAYLLPKNHTLPTVAMILAVSSIIMACCLGGVWLGLPAAVLGFIGLRNADQHPDRYGGRGMAIGAMIIGAVTFVASLIWIFAAVLGG